MTDLKDLNIQIFQEEDGSYYAEVKNLPGCFTAANTIEDLEINLKEAINSYILSLQKDLINVKFNISSKDITYA
ncbi:MAG: type II toxin-antitoxin system HicB family antitoxin [Candidatus Gracilibacteria bacterium]|nr:type II toxin-antitoxin system HicB family antitoxin [Candidatus Gracilibacteria bacterium]